MFSERGPNFLNYVQHIFPGGKKHFLGGLRPPGYELDDEMDADFAHLT